MRILLTSDTHYGMDHNTDKIHRKWLLKAKDENPDIVIHAGDWISSKQKQFKRTIEIFRETFPVVPILTVRGNHDFWDGDEEFGSIHEIFKQHEEWFREFNIHHLSKPFEKDGVAFFGFDGWYHNLNPETNDLAWMPNHVDGIPVHQYLSKLAHKDLGNLIGLDFIENGWIEKISVCVTHFPPFEHLFGRNPYGANPQYMQFLIDKFDFLCVGHSHKKEDFVKGMCRVLNSGSDYNKPAYLLFETGIE